MLDWILQLTRLAAPRRRTLEETLSLWRTFLDGSADLAPGLVLLALGALFYGLSISYHRKNGELFKSLFDLYRDKLAPLTRLGKRESDRWHGVWSYLQYLFVACANCGWHTPASEERCRNPRCGFPTQRSLEALEVQAGEEDGDR